MYVQSMSDEGSSEGDFAEDSGEVSLGSGGDDSLLVRTIQLKLLASLLVVLVFLNDKTGRKCCVLLLGFKG
jgi:hypothetical protein